MAGLLYPFYRGRSKGWGKLRDMFKVTQGSHTRAGYLNLCSCDLSVCMLNHCAVCFFSLWDNVIIVPHRKAGGTSIFPRNEPMKPCSDSWQGWMEWLNQGSTQASSLLLPGRLYLVSHPQPWTWVLCSLPLDSLSFPVAWAPVGMGHQLGQVDVWWGNDHMMNIESSSEIAHWVEVRITPVSFLSALGKRAAGWHRDGLAAHMLVQFFLNMKWCWWAVREGGDVPGACCLEPCRRKAHGPPILK